MDFVIVTKPASLEQFMRWLVTIQDNTHEVVDKYGNMADWHNACGTGPFMLTDYVSGASATFVKNPNYWGTDPLHPENKLPYLDGVKVLFIQDNQTRLTAMRIGKIDFLGGFAEDGVQLDDALNLMKTNPNLVYKSYYVVHHKPFG